MRPDPGRPSSPRHVLETFVRQLPKAELHVHLEGSWRPRTLLDLARRHGVELPARDEAGLADWFRFRDFAHFVDVYLTCSRCLRDPEDFERLAADFLAEQASQGVVWSEVHFTISTHRANGGEVEAIRAALRSAAEKAEREMGTRVAWIPDIVRNAPVERADWTVEWALDARRPGASTGEVVALGLGGMEQGYPADPFIRHYEAVAAAGLHRVAHAGEHGGPKSVWTALDQLGAERIGHGVRSIEDPVLVAELARRQVPLEVCPSSNVCLGVFPSLGAHSFEPLRRAGLALSVGSDDPPLFATTLVEEYLRLAETFGYGPEAIVDLVVAGFEQSFLSRDEKRERIREVRQRAAELGEALLGWPIAQSTTGSTHSGSGR